MNHLLKTSTQLRQNYLQVEEDLEDKIEQAQIVKIMSDMVVLNAKIESITTKLDNEEEIKENEIIQEYKNLLESANAKITKLENEVNTINKTRMADQNASFEFQLNAKKFETLYESEKVMVKKLESMLADEKNKPALKEFIREESKESTPISWDVIPVRDGAGQVLNYKLTPKE